MKKFVFTGLVMFCPALSASEIYLPLSNSEEVNFKDVSITQDYTSCAISFDTSAAENEESVEQIIDAVNSHFSDESNLFRKGGVSVHYSGAGFYRASGLFSIEPLADEYIGEYRQLCESFTYTFANGEVVVAKDVVGRTVRLTYGLANKITNLFSYVRDNLYPQNFLETYHTYMTMQGSIDQGAAAFKEDARLRLSPRKFDFFARKFARSEYVFFSFFEKVEFADGSFSGDRIYYHMVGELFCRDLPGGVCGR